MGAIGEFLSRCEKSNNYMCRLPISPSLVAKKERLSNRISRQMLIISKLSAVYIVIRNHFHFDRKIVETIGKHTICQKGASNV